MSDVKQLICELSEIALHPGKSAAKAIRDSGREGFGCFPIYTPEEIIYAAGLLPIGMWGGKTELKLADTYLQGFCCSIMRANIEFGMKGTYDLLKGIALPTFCDTLKCVCENWKVAVPHIPILPIVYPQNRNIEAGFRYMQDEFQRVRGELEKLTGNKITDQALEEAFAIYEDWRGVMREFVSVAAAYPVTVGARARHLIIKSSYFMDKRDHREKVSAIIEELKSQEPEKFSGVRAIATGLLGEPTDLLAIFEENEIVIVGDDLAQESRQFRTAARREGTALERMCRRIADQKGCTFLYEVEKSRGRMLIDMVKEKQAQAVVVFMMKFCDPEEFDYPVYKKELEEAGIPILYLEIDQQIDSYEQIRTRVQSFAEMLI